MPVRLPPGLARLLTPGIDRFKCSGAKGDNGYCLGVLQHDLRESDARNGDHIGTGRDQLRGKGIENLGSPFSEASVDRQVRSLDVPKRAQIRNKHLERASIEEAAPFRTLTKVA